jgi:polysaccharide pyruvyl transferase WcaK-like protein
MAKNIVRPSDVLFTMEGKDRDYQGQFPSNDIRLFNNGVEFFDTIINECGMLVSQRFHGAILGLRALIPVVFISEYSPHKLQDLAGMVGESSYYSTVTDFMSNAEASRRLMLDSCSNAQLEVRRQKIEALQEQFMRDFKTALVSSQLLECPSKGRAYAVISPVYSIDVCKIFCSR